MMGREDISENMTLRVRIEQALKLAEKSDVTGEVRLATLRLIACAVADRDICARGAGEGKGCEDSAVRKILETMAAQRDISAREYDAAGRIEDAMREREEIETIAEFLPQLLQGEALEAAVAEIIEDVGASKLKDLGRCMSELKERYPGLIDTGKAGKAVKDALRGAAPS